MIVELGIIIGRWSSIVLGCFWLVIFGALLTSENSRHTRRYSIPDCLGLLLRVLGSLGSLWAGLGRIVPGWHLLIELCGRSREGNWRFVFGYGPLLGWWHHFVLSSLNILNLLELNRLGVEDIVFV